MKEKFSSEISVSILLVVILLTFIMPTKLLMPVSVEMIILLFLILFSLIFFSLVWKEKFADERENLHRLHAGRVSFLVGSSVLVLGIVLQSLKHDVDPWLVYTLVLMVLAKTISRVYLQVKQ